MQLEERLQWNVAERFIGVPSLDILDFLEGRGAPRRG
jgi:hypothetical protein